MCRGVRNQPAAHEVLAQAAHTVNEVNFVFETGRILSVPDVG